MTDDLVPKAIELGIAPKDIEGHEAIKRVFGLNSVPNLIDRECIDFSTPKNFPPQIIKSIKAGRMTFGIGNYRMLTAAANAEYARVVEPAYAEYARVVEPAYAEYARVVNAAYAEYARVCVPAFHVKVEPAYAEYDHVLTAAFWSLFAILENRAESWK